MAAINIDIGVVSHGSRSFLGFPRIGRDRELKKAQEAFWKGELDEAGLRAVGRDLRKTHWDLQNRPALNCCPPVISPGTTRYWRTR